MLGEVKIKRTARSKTFLDAIDPETGARTYHAETHAGVIHYDNWTGAGDGVEGWRGIDHTLVDGGDYWTAEYLPFAPKLPKYADDWIEFLDRATPGKNLLTRFRASDAAHALGRVVASIPGECSVNSVIYDDAFGAGIDLVLMFQRTALVKAVRVRAGTVLASDLDIRFEFDAPAEAVIRREGPQNPYELDRGNSPKVFDTDKRTDITVGGHTTHIRPFTIWETGAIPRSESIDVTYSRAGGASYLTKHIPKSFVDSATADVYTDATLSVFADANDTWLRRSNASYTNARENDISDTATGSPLQISAGMSGASFFFDRSLLRFDTSAIPAAATIDDATMYATARGSDVAGETVESVLVAVQWDGVGSIQDYATALSGDTFFPLNGATALAPNVTGALVVDDEYSWAFNASGLAEVTKGGNTDIGMRELGDVDNAASGRTTLPFHQWYAVEEAGTAKDPRIEVGYTLPNGDMKMVGPMVGGMVSDMVGPVAG